MEDKKKKFYKKWWFWLIIVLCLMAIIGSTTNNKTNEENTINTTENIEETEISENNRPSNDNYKKYVYEIFDNYYTGDYNFSGDQADWNIINLDTDTLYRSKLEGIAIIDNQRYKFTIIMEFTDNTYSDYTITNFEVGNNKII